MINKIDTLREAIASQLGFEKSYNLPQICEKYGLTPGEASEAFNSKRNYVLLRLKSKNEKFILELSKKLISDYESDIIGNAFNIYSDGEYYKISNITRQNILNDLGFIEKNGFTNSHDLTILDKHFLEFLEKQVHPETQNEKCVEKYINIINKHLKVDGFELTAVDTKSGRLIYKAITINSVNTQVKNIIFAANGYKPEIIINDALSNKIEIVKNSEYCLVYDKPINSQGLLFVDLVKWWSELNKIEIDAESAKLLLNRLKQSLSPYSEPEKLFLDTYYNKYKITLGRSMPALIPQVYLHYDPFTIKKFGYNYLLRQRMDFLFLFSDYRRIVIEIDGVQHYSENEKPSPKIYSQMVAADRDLKLRGYEVYRFGGYELMQPNANVIIENFFESLFQKHSII